MRNSRAACLAVVSLLAAAGAAAQVWRGPAAIGVEARSRKGQPIAGAEVLLTYQGVRGSGGPVAVSTGPKGRVVVAGLVEGEWQIEVSHPEYLSYVAVLVVRRARKPTVGASFLQAGGRSLEPLRVDFFKTSGEGASPPPARVAEAAPEAGGPQEAAAPAQETPPTSAPPATAPTAAPPAPTAEAPTPEAPSAASPTAPPPEAAAPTMPPPFPAAPSAEAPTQLPPVGAEPTAPGAGATVAAAAEKTAREAEAAAAPPRAAVPVAPPPPAAAADTPPAAPSAPAAQTEPAPPAVESAAATAPLPSESPAPEAPTPTPTPAPPPMPEREPEPPAAAPEPRMPEPEPPTAEPTPPAAEPEPPAAEPEPPAAEPEPPAAAPVAPRAADPPTTAEQATEPLPEPAVAATAPEPTPPAEPGPPPAPAPTRRSPTLRSAGEGGCPECRGGEWAVASSGVSTADAARPCDESLRSAVAAAMRRLSTSIQLELEAWAGSVGDGSPYDGLQIVPQGTATAVRGALPEDAGGCRPVAVVLPRGARFVGFQYSAADGDGASDCLPDADCPIGGALWHGRPEVVRGSSAIVVYGLFENRTRERARRGDLTVYFRPASPKWQPPAGF